MQPAGTLQTSCTRNDWLRIASVLTVGCVALAISAFVPTLWARQAGVLADIALSLVAIAIATLATFFLPIWASRWRTVAIGILAIAVLTMLAGSIEGASVGRSTLVTIKLAGLLLGFATIWISFSPWPAIRRFCWLALVIWSLGFPTAAYLYADFASDQGPPSTILHLSIARILQ